MPYLTGATHPARSGTSGTAFAGLPPHKTGDILGYLVSHQEAAQAGGVDVDGFTLKTDHQNGVRSLQLWWRRAEADDEADPVITHTFSGVHSFVPFKISGAIETGDPFDAVATASVSGSPVDSPTVTTTEDDCGILTGYVADSAPTFSSITNATTNPRCVEGRNQPNTVGFLAWGHMPTAGATGTTAWALNVGVSASTATWAIKPAASPAPDTAPTFRDSILSTANSGSVITLPTHADGDLLVAIISGDSNANVLASTLTGFTRKAVFGDVGQGRPMALLTLRATSGAMSNPTWTHSFGADTRGLIIFSIPGDLKSLNWDAGANGQVRHHLESESAAKVVGFFNSHASENWTAVDYDVATNETEVEDGGAGLCRMALYHADLAAAGWIGAPTTHTAAFGSGQAFMTMAFGEVVAVNYDETGRLVTAAAAVTATDTLNLAPAPPAPSTGGARMGVGRAIRHHPRRRGSR